MQTYGHVIRLFPFLEEQLLSSESDTTSALFSNRKTALLQSKSTANEHILSNLAYTLFTIRPDQIMHEYQSSLKISLVRN